MQELVKDIPNIEVKEMMTKYPQGGERTLIYAVTGREINSSMLLLMLDVLWIMLRQFAVFMMQWYLADQS